VKTDLICIAAYGPWHPGVPPGKHLIYATPDGSHAPGASRRKFLVPSEDYENGQRPFPIDTAKHEEVL